MDEIRKDLNQKISMLAAAGYLLPSSELARRSEDIINRAMIFGMFVYLRSHGKLAEAEALIADIQKTAADMAGGLQ